MKLQRASSLTSFRPLQNEPNAIQAPPSPSSMMFGSMAFPSRFFGVLRVRRWCQGALCPAVRIVAREDKASNRVAFADQQIWHTKVQYDKASHFCLPRTLCAMYSFKEKIINSRRYPPATCPCLHAAFGQKRSGPWRSPVALVHTPLTGCRPCALIRCRPRYREFRLAPIWRCSFMSRIHRW